MQFLELLFHPLRCFCLLRWNSWMFLTDIRFSWLECLQPHLLGLFLTKLTKAPMCAKCVLPLHYRIRRAFVKCSKSLTHLFCSSELLSLDTNQAGKFFHTTTKGSGSSFCFANADQNTPVRRGRVQRDFFPTVKISRQVAENYGKFLAWRVWHMTST